MIQVKSLCNPLIVSFQCKVKEISNVNIALLTDMLKRVTGYTAAERCWTQAMEFGRKACHLTS